jgi:hypothetical protein
MSGLDLVEAEDFSSSRARRWFTALLAVAKKLSRALTTFSLNKGARRKVTLYLLNWATIAVIFNVSSTVVLKQNKHVSPSGLLLEAQLTKLGPGVHALLFKALELFIKCELADDIVESPEKPFDQVLRALAAHGLQLLAEGVNIVLYNGLNFSDAHVQEGRSNKAS